MKTKKFGFLHKIHFPLKTITSKIVTALVLDCIILTILVMLVFSSFSISLEETLILTKLKTDINYLEDILSDFKYSEWRILDGTLYCGRTMIGDGSEEKANLSPFYSAEEYTGTFVYAFLRCSDKGLEWVGDDDTGYMQGHFIRVAGTTKGPDGESIIGTYIDKKVADILDEKGEYSGAANVSGSQIFCYYKVLKNTDGNVVGAIVVGRDMDEIYALAKKAWTNIFFIVLMIILISAVGMFLILSKWTKHVEAISKYINRIDSGELPDDPLIIKSSGELSAVADSINSMVVSLKDKERIGSELNIAANIQASLLPKIFPPFPHRHDFELFASMQPAKEVGGDFYDFFMIDPDHIALVIADVSGKGVPAALFMVTARTLIKDHALEGMTAADVFTAANQLLCEGNDTGLFVTGWIGIVELSTGKVNFANAGHNPPLLCQNGSFSFLRSKPGFVLAGMEGVRYKNQEFVLENNDILYLYTDGVTESTNLNNELYGDDRLLAFANQNKDLNMQDFCIAIKQDTERFTGEAVQFDDVTMLGFRYLGGGKNHYQLTVDAVVESIPKITDFADHVLEDLGCLPKAQMQINIAIDEIASNICFYAYQGASGSINFRIDEIENNRISLKFIDKGIAYNPLEQKSPDLTLNAQERAIGGLGIHIVRKTMDEMLYEYNNGQNILTLIKTIK